MSIADRIRNLWGRKAPPVESAEDESRMGMSMQDQTLLQAPEPPQKGTGPAGSGADIPPADAPAKESSDEDLAAASQLIYMPLLGWRTFAQHQGTLAVLVGSSLLVLLMFTALTLNQTNTVAEQLYTVRTVQLESQRLATELERAAHGSAPSFEEAKKSAALLFRAGHALTRSDPELGMRALPAAQLAGLVDVLPALEVGEKAVAVVLANGELMYGSANLQKAVRSELAAALKGIEQLEAARASAKVGLQEEAAFRQLKFLAIRIDRSLHELLDLTEDYERLASVRQIEKDHKAFAALANEVLSLVERSPQSSEELQWARDIRSNVGKVQSQIESLLPNGDKLQALSKAYATAFDSIERVGEPLARAGQALDRQAGVNPGTATFLVFSALVLMVALVAFVPLQLRASELQQRLVVQQRERAEHQEREARRVNDANQAAILRLMNELQLVAEGDLTHEATVTEDITGAIADSVNYTVEELRTLVASVQNTAARVAQTTTEVDSTSTELLAASNEQLHEIRETGRSVLDMAQRINQVSSQAQESARVARQSLQAAETGLRAVQNSIGGMNAIRDQIQETSKRIKRLGESSQEIGEITELISDITEQTNVLALNAAIQAASAGEAGRGFSVVAEEVQRLAERSADATRQIAALVKAIQTDTQDAIGAMERSTQGVVEGARLSDDAGAALAEIESVTRRVADLIEQISGTTSREAGLANVVAENIQHIFAVTEQTGDGTRSTAAQVRELSRMAEELRQSVSRFKIS